MKNIIALILALFCFTVINAQVIKTSLVSGDSTSFPLAMVSLIYESTNNYTQFTFHDISRRRLISIDSIEAITSLVGASCIELSGLVINRGRTILVPAMNILRLERLGTGKGAILLRNPYERRITTEVDYSTLCELYSSALVSAASAGISISNNNVLYVADNGDNSTAVKGDIANPWADPWAAKDAAVSGDIIKVFPGEYTTGILGSGTDREDDGTDREYTSLMKDGVTYVLDPGATIRNTKVTSGMQPIFYDTTGAKTVVLGNGSIFNDDGDAYIGYFDNAATELTLICHEVISNDLNGGWDHGFFLQDFERLYVGADRIEATNVRFVNMGTGSISGASVTFDVGEVFSYEADSFLDGNTGSRDNVEIVFRAKYMYHDQNYVSFTHWNELWTNSNGLIHIGTMEAIQSGSNPLFNFDDQSKTDCNFVVRIDNYQGGVPLFGNTGATLTNTTVKFEGNYHNTSSSHEMVDTDASATCNDCYWIFDGVFHSDSTDVILLQHNLGNVILRGRFSTLGAQPVLNITNTGNNITLQDVVLSNDGTVAAVQSNGSITINTAGAYQESSSLTDTDVTFAELYNYAGGFKRTTSAAGNYTVLTTDHLIAKTGITGGGDTVTLPSGAAADQKFIIKDESGAAGTDNITIATEGSENIDGAATQTISANYGVVRVYFDGSNYFTW
jgi:hypothetical protein